MRTTRIFHHIRSNIIGYICLFWLTTGTAAAATHFALNSVGPQQLRSNAVTNVKLANNAVTAAKVRRNSLTGAQINAATLGTVPSAAHAANADAAATAANAARLGGASPAAFQSRIAKDCPDGSAVRHVNADGTVVCQHAGAVDSITNLGNMLTLGGTPAKPTINVNPEHTQVRVSSVCSTGITTIGENGGTDCLKTGVAAFASTLNDNQSRTMDISTGTHYSGLSIDLYCHRGGTYVRFENHSGAGASLNWMFSDGGTAVNARGISFANNAYQDITFGNPRVIEGQFIFAPDSGVTTINLHAFDGDSFCEVRGTAVVAS